ncbi:MAG: hypothetical protein QS748_06515 [Candidatus Endonucleobacter bathymodioli]|uniref:SWIM-type domain-containing protein n=1 Tax=Candidatus Endonucleibacter bathymodioli TaxID=539814 RepID=A0AA90NLC3_9GAMM|nr:hypothetical protein [Candidatus Endonucleobacter bathymodioli]
MKNRWSIIIALATLLSGSSMASLDSILEQFAKLEIFDTNSNLEDRSSTCSHLDALIANNKAMPESWLPQPCCEQEAQLKNTIAMLDEPNLRNYLSQFKDYGELADKLLILKDHEYYHYIFFQTVMGLRRDYSTNEQICENIIQEKIKLLPLGRRHFEERPFSVRKFLDVFRMNVEYREEELGLETLGAKYSNLCGTDKDSDNPVRTSFLVYMSEGRKCNLNCLAYRNGELMTCRHLAAWWLQLEEFEYGDIDSEENIGKCTKIPCSAELDKSFMYNRCPSEGIYFEISQFHNVICDVAISLSEGQEKRYLIGSIVHDMGLCIKKINIIILLFIIMTLMTPSTQRDTLLVLR